MRCIAKGLKESEFVEESDAAHRAIVVNSLLHEEMAHSAPMLEFREH